MPSVLLLAGIAVAVFVGFNIGGSSTGVAFGPAVGSDVTSKTVAAALMSGFALLGGATLGQGVIETMGGGLSLQATLISPLAWSYFSSSASRC